MREQRKPEISISPNSNRLPQSIKFISRQVGHLSAKLTLDIYSHLMEGAEEVAMGRLQEQLMSGV